MNLVGAKPVKKSPAHPAKPASAERIEAPNVPRDLIPRRMSQAPTQPAPEQKADVVQEKTAVAEEKEPKITAIVCELINQELSSVAKRFRLKLTDNNLWELTKAALEDVRPEFSSDSKETEKKLERLRPQVIAAMTKAEIKVKNN